MQFPLAEENPRRKQRRDKRLDWWSRLITSGDSRCPGLRTSMQSVGKSYNEESTWNICKKRAIRCYPQVVAVLFCYVTSEYVFICHIDRAVTVIKLPSQSSSKSFRCNQNVLRCHQCVTFIWKAINLMLHKIVPIEMPSTVF